MKDHEKINTGRPAKGNLELAKVNTGGVFNVQISKVTKAITISDATESNMEQEDQLKQNQKDKLPV